MALWIPDPIRGPYVSPNGPLTISAIAKGLSLGSPDSCCWVPAYVIRSSLSGQTGLGKASDFGKSHWGPCFFPSGTISTIRLFLLVLALPYLSLFIASLP